MNRTIREQVEMAIALEQVEIAFYVVEHICDYFLWYTKSMSKQRCNAIQSLQELYEDIQNLIEESEYE